MTLLRRAIECLYDWQTLRPARLRTLVSKCLRILWPGEPNFYEENLHDMTAGKYSDPRDSVYGALALAPDSIMKLIRPQYSLAVEEV